MSSLFLRWLMAGSALALVSVAALAENITPNLQFNGFATVGAAWVDGSHTGEYLNNGLGRSGIQHDPSIGYDSVVGLQFRYKANDKVDLVTQMVAKGRTSDDGSTAPWALGADWAYIAYHVNDQLTVRGGRFGLNTYMYSENQRVGQAYPWARLPAEVYAPLPSENYDGIDALFKQPVGDWTLTVQPYVGSFRDNNFTVNRLQGLNLNFGNDNLSFHAGSAESQVDFTVDLSKGQLAQLIAFFPATAALIDVKKNRSSYTDFGILFDDGEWFFATEYGQLRNKGWVQDFNSGYVSAGHYFGDWLPYVLFSRLKTVNNQATLDAFSAFPPFVGNALLAASRKAQETRAVGVRYQLRPNTSLKAQVDQISGFDGTPGLFGGFSDPSGPTQLRKAYLYSLSLNVSF